MYIGCIFQLNHFFNKEKQLALVNVSRISQVGTTHPNKQIQENIINKNKTNMYGGTQPKPKDKENYKRYCSSFHSFDQ